MPHIAVVPQAMRRPKVTLHHLTQKPKATLHMKADVAVMETWEVHAKRIVKLFQVLWH
ncbi:MAG: hypothetical protein SFW65_09975 [Alphaproteobacteria bacterium]|nr:hypothetical protein [Alphaproteobacteria bacterium]